MSTMPFIKQPLIRSMSGSEKLSNDPEEAAKLLSQSWFQLPLKERNDIQEEIHGVRCLSREETPEYLRESLEELALALRNDNLVPLYTKNAYIRSQQHPDTYVNDDNFRLRFLRFEGFDVTKAAQKIVLFLEMVAIFFGEDALKRPIRLSDLCNKEKQFMRKGQCQFLPSRDRSGRRVCAFINPPVMNQRELPNYPEMSKYEKSNNKAFCFGKILMYMSWTAGYDIDTQRRGVVYLVWFDSNHELDVNGDVIFQFPGQRLTHLLTVRPGAIHCCMPDTPRHRFIPALFSLRLNQTNRPRVKFHIGTSIEVQYALLRYGIPSQDMPISFSGTIKFGIIKRWMRLRDAIEFPQVSESANRIGVHNNIVESPQLNDVLFRQGKSMLNNPGNSIVRNLIERKHKEHFQTENQNAKMNRRKVVLEIIEEIHITGRFLIWNDNGWWNELNDVELLINKIEYMIKDYRKSIKRRHRAKVDSSSILSRSHDNVGSCICHIGI